MIKQPKHHPRRPRSPRRPVVPPQVHEWDVPELPQVRPLRKKFAVHACGDQVWVTRLFDEHWTLSTVEDFCAALPSAEECGLEVFPGGPRWLVLDAPITTLAPEQVFVFGSNASGFHGAGSAGQAMRGDACNTWRHDPAFLRAMKSPVGSAGRVGLWAVYGVARGPMLGTSGKSYAVQTVTDTGKKRSLPLADIHAQL